MNTTRDLNIVDFLTDYKVASTSTIAELFFPSKMAAYKRLHVLNEKKQIKRLRDSINNEYVYFKKLPKQLKHSLLVTDFYRELHKIAEIISFKIEPTMEDIRPDAVFGYKYNSRSYIGFLEVEISNKGFNFAKYERFNNSEQFKKFLPVMPTVFIVGDRVKVPSDSKVKYIVIKTDFSNLKGVL